MCGTLAGRAGAKPVAALSLYGAPKYSESSAHFAYANPGAPKGGTLALGALGTFDSLNPFIIKGAAAAGLGETYDTLMVQSADEPFAVYAHVAATIDVDKALRTVEFVLDPAARFSDGTPVEATDVAFTFKALVEKGSPGYAFTFADVAGVQALDARRVRFALKKGYGRELPLVLAGLPVLSAKYWADKDFSATTLEPPVSGGAYRIAEAAPGKRIVYERNPDYWAAGRWTQAGRNNFDRIVYEYYRDSTVLVESLKSGAIDLRAENEAKKWATAYNDSPRLARVEFPSGNPKGMQGLVMNSRRALFADPRVRQALAFAFDFEWTNARLFFGSYTRCNSYFNGSPMGASGLPSGKELKLLEKYRAHLPPEAFGPAYQAPRTDGSGFPRANLKRALELLADAGWTPRAGVLRNAAGQPFEFTILLDGAWGGAWERATLPFARNLGKLGIKAKVSVADSLMYERRTRDFDFDMVVMSWPQSVSPGNELRYYFGSEAADAPGSYNAAGIKNPAVDALVEEVVAASDTETLWAATRALDRALTFGYWVVPHWYLPASRLVVNAGKLAWPEGAATKEVDLMTWWVRP
ncbi:ABC transporter substrate-binding protein [Alphaproteobacteria bacterium]|nr:ABC transporter substrate-binding protein [Alphaproteobacteria bacterium]